LQAIKNLDYEQYKMVREALHERATVLKIAPHLSYQMPIMLPIYKWWQVRALHMHCIGCRIKYCVGASDL
jgi:glycerol-3-phosphate dehydrogenase